MTAKMTLDATKDGLFFEIEGTANDLAIVIEAILGKMQDTSNVTINTNAIDEDEVAVWPFPAASSTTRQLYADSDTADDGLQDVELTFRDGQTRVVTIDADIDPSVFDGYEFNYHDAGFGGISIYSKDCLTNGIGSKSFPAMLYGDDYYMKQRNYDICDGNPLYYGSDAFTNV